MGPSELCDEVSYNRMIKRHGRITPNEEDQFHLTPSDIEANVPPFSIPNGQKPGTSK